MILNRQREVRVARRLLESFLRRVKRELALGKSDLTVCLMSDAEISRLNQDFRKKSGPTDVLSFPQKTQWRVASGPSKLRASEWRERKKTVRGSHHNDLTRRGAKGTGKSREHLEKHHRWADAEAGYLGDIAISPATARRYGKKHGRNVTSELRVLILHGVLHLLGFDHETDNGEMDRIERKLRTRLGLS